MLYSRKDYELELEEIEKISQSLSRWCVLEQENGSRNAGHRVLLMEQELNARRREAKGKLLATRSILSDSDKKSSCSKPKEHAKGCKCKKLYKTAKVAEMNDELTQLKAKLLERVNGIPVEEVEQRISAI